MAHIEIEVKVDGTTTYSLDRVFNDETTTVSVDETPTDTAPESAPEETAAPTDTPTEQPAEAAPAE